MYTLSSVVIVTFFNEPDIEISSYFYSLLDMVLFDHILHLHLKHIGDDP